MTAPLLVVEGVSQDFGGVRALNRVSFEVAEGEMLGLIGPNGAGKTTLMNLISGVHRPTEGAIRFAGQPLRGHRADVINHMGIARTFQVPKPFVGMSVRENVMTASLFGGDPARSAPDRRESVDEALELVGLAGRAELAAEALNVAGRKRLELARVLSMRPRLLLLDEVMAGLNLKEVEAVMEVIRRVNDGGVTVVLIEHVMKAVMGLATRIVVLHHGQVLAQGTPAAVTRNAEVVAAYLGRGVAYQDDVAGTP